MTDAAGPAGPCYSPTHGTAVRKGCRLRGMPLSRGLHSRDLATKLKKAPHHLKKKPPSDTVVTYHTTPLHLYQVYEYALKGTKVCTALAVRM